MAIFTSEQLKAKIDAGEAITLVDVRDTHTYQEKHIPGAISVPMGEDFSRFIGNLIPDKATQVVIYDSFKEDPMDQKAVALLTSLGYSNVLSLDDGFMGWLEKGYKVEFGWES